MRMKKYALMLVAMMAIMFACPAYASGVWSPPGEWMGASDDKRGPELAKNFRVMIENKKTNVTIYDILLKWKKTSYNSGISIDGQAMSKKPANIIWTGRYNGHNEEKETDFDDQNLQKILFTCSSAGTNPVKVYAIDGVITWTASTKRENAEPDDLDKICIVWDNTKRARVIMGKWLRDLLEENGLFDESVYEANDNH